MPRPPRSATGDVVYHVLNRANARMAIFKKDRDYSLFEETLEEAKEKCPMRILSYSLMPNHWHFVVYPSHDDDMPRFMRWLTLTHTQRWHVAHHTTGYGHLYQGRYKSFPVQKDEHFLQLVRYVERNAQRASLVQRAEDWRWSSLHRREYGTTEQQRLLSLWPITPDKDYIQLVNDPQSHEELTAIRHAILRGSPLGKEAWIKKTARRLGLESTLAPRGRPRKST